MPLRDFRERIDPLATEHPQLARHCCCDRAVPEDPVDAQGDLTEARLGEWLPASRGVDVHFLGPRPFMRLIKRNLHHLGVPDKQARDAFFGPAEALACGERPVERHASGVERDIAERSTRNPFRRLWAASGTMSHWHAAPAGCGIMHGWSDPPSSSMPCVNPRPRGRPPPSSCCGTQRPASKC